MATGDVWRVIFGFQWGQVQCRPGFHLVEGGGGVDPDPATAVSEAVIAALGATPLEEFSDQLALNSLIIEDIQPGTSPTKTFPFTVPYVGDVVDLNPLPPDDSAVVSLHTALKPVTGAFAAAGRMYLPGIPQSGQISGFLQSSFQLGLQAFVELLKAAFIDDGTAYQWHVVSYTPGSKPRTVRAIQPVTSYTINNIVREQRRRQPGVGI